jgi:O-antigen/teichoic acid export membrane protein
MDFAAGFYMLWIIAALYAAMILALFLTTGLTQFFATPDAAIKNLGGLALCLSSILLLPRLPFYLGLNAYFSFREARLNAVFDTLSGVGALAGLLIGMAFALPLLPTIALYQIGNVGFCGLALYFFLKRRNWNLHTNDFVRRIKINAKNSYAFALLSFAGLILNSSSTFVVAAVVDVAQAGPFRAMLTIFQAILALQLTAIMPVWSEFSFAIANGKEAGISGMLRKVALNSSIFAVPILGFAILAPWVIQLWLDAPRGGYLLPVLLSGWAILMGVNNLLSVVLNGIGRPILSFLALLPGALSILPVSLFFGHLYGAAGVAGAFLVLSGITAVLLSLMVLGWMRTVQRR